MPSSYTTSLGLEKIATGEQDGTWGDTTNINWDLVDQSLVGQVDVTLVATGSTGAPNALTITDGAASDGRNYYVNYIDGGDLGADCYAQLAPNTAKKICFIANNLSGGRDLYIFQGTYNAARDYVLPNGSSAIIKFDGNGASSSTVTNMYATAIFPSLNVTGAFTAGSAAIDNILIDGNTISSTAGTDLNITPLAGQQIVLDATIVVDAGVVTGATSITSTAFVGDLTGDVTGTLQTAAQTNITSVGTLTGFTSTGIDDNATGEVLQIEDAQQVIGPADTTEYGINRAGTTGFISLNGGGNTNAAELQLYGEAHATEAGDLKFISGGLARLIYDYSQLTWDFQASAITTTGALTCGTFTSTGIDDNATGERLEISNAGMVLGTAATTSEFALVKKDGEGVLTISGGSSKVLGGLLTLYGQDNASAGGDIFFKSETLQLYYDHSASSWDFKANTIEWAFTSEDLPFFNFVATADADTTSAISTLTTSGATTHHVQVDINGTKAWIAVSTTNPS